MKLSLGIEIGGTKLQVGVGESCDGTLKALVRRTIDPARASEGIRDQICGLADEACAAADVRPRDLGAVGVGFGGPVDSRTGRVLASYQIGGWAGFPLGDWLADRLHTPVVVQNDAQAAGYAEALHGAGKGFRRVFYMTVGSGVGGGLVTDGRLDDGQGLGLGEIGHTWVPHPDTGRPTELELLASGWSIGRRAREAVAQGIRTTLSANATAESVHAAAMKQDALACKLVDQTTDALALSIANVIALLHPERIVVGGGVSLMGPLFWNPLRAKVRQASFGPFADSCALVPAALGASVVVVGAVLLAQRRSGTRRDERDDPPLILGEDQDC